MIEGSVKRSYLGHIRRDCQTSEIPIKNESTLYYSTLQLIAATAQTVPNDCRTSRK